MFPGIEQIAESKTAETADFSLTPHANLRPRSTMSQTEYGSDLKVKTISILGGMRIANNNANSLVPVTLSSRRQED